MSAPIFMGLDGEMTGLDMHQGHKLCQVGLSFGACETYNSIVGWPHRDLACNPESMAVHGISRQAIAEGPSRGTVEAEMTQFVVTRTTQRVHSVGWNVAGFDIPWFRSAFPEFSQRCLHYRTVDLNALCFALSHTDNEYKRVKEASKRWARDILGGTPRDHEAGYDAAASLLSFYYLRARMEWRGE